MSLSVIQQGANAFEREFVECTVIACPFISGTTDEQLWQHGYNKMDRQIQAEMTPLAIN